MNNQWTRAFRCTARNPQQTRLAPRPTRPFHSTVPRRAAAAAAADDAPRDDGRKPDENGTSGTGVRAGAGTGTGTGGTGTGTGAGAGREGTGAEAAGEKNLIGDNVTTTNGENMDRKKPANGTRSRPWRSRRSDHSPDLPPVEIPKSFLDMAIDRHDKAPSFLKIGSTNYPQPPPQLLRRRSRLLFDAAAWSPSLVEDAIQTLKSGGSLRPLIRRMDVFGLSAYWTVLHQIESMRPPEESLEFTVLQELTSTPPHSSLDMVTALLGYDAKTKEEPIIFKKEFTKLLLRQITEHGEISLTKVALYEPCMIDEVVTALRAELHIRAPKNSRPASASRPVTIVNVHDFSGFSVAEDTLQHAAQKLGADVIHLRAHDIAYVVGRYIGQDITRSQGDLSLLGYRAAENSGRIIARPPIEDENEEPRSFEVPYTMVFSGDKSRKDIKRQTINMDRFLLSSGTRGKNDELWEDLKINAALEELIHSADVEAAEQKPLIIHINDFNAINMDETGATILSNIRKIVDGLWLSGRKVALVGSCSTKDAPKSYQTAMKGLETNERVIHISRRYFSDAKLRVNSEYELVTGEKIDNLRENEENIVRMLWSMTESDDSTLTESKRALGLIYKPGAPILDKLFPSYWHTVLPTTEIYRIATTMISLSSLGAAELFSHNCFEKAATRISAVDAARERTAATSKASRPAEESRDIPTGMRRTDPLAENHEEKLMSGMVNAQDIRTTFKDIHVPKETIESIKMLTTLSLVRPEAFSYGVLANDRIPGCLLYGPPGTGKTLLAKAVAKESGANMIEVSGASINHMYVGESEKNVRALFRLAKKKQPMVIFIDEADALLGARTGSRNGNRRETINQFLREWDGMDKDKAFIMAATNRPYDLDEAVLRRLPRKLLIDLPLEADRASILKIHLKDELMDETVSIEDIAKRTPLYSGSDLKNICVAAAMAAVKEELDASERHVGPEPYQWAAKRLLSRRHFDKGLEEIGASVSEDMASLTAIRKFDERYGDGKARNKRKGMGFEVVPEAPDSEQARVRHKR